MLLIQRTYVGWKYALFIEIIISSLFFFNHCHSYVAVYFLEMFFITCNTYVYMCIVVMFLNDVFSLVSAILCHLQMGGFSLVLGSDRKRVNQVRHCTILIH